MGFRTVVIKNRCKLEYSLNYLVCRGDEEKRINVNEIETLIIQNIGVSITAALLSRLMEAKIKVIFCDPKSNPQGELEPYFGTYDSRTKILKQFSWKETIKDKVWKEIIKEKIKRQSMVLKYKNKFESSMLERYIDELVDGDATNREGHAAKVYFNSLFGKDFVRGDDENQINAYLNYGYSIILSAINREIKSFGYLTELGIHHKGETNPFNLGCDLMEPLRPLIDYCVVSEKVNEENFKNDLINILEAKVSFGESTMFLDNAIHLYVQSVLIALNECDVSRVKFIGYEFD